LKNTRYDLQDPTVPASAPQQQYSAMLDGCSIATVTAPDAVAAAVAVENLFKSKGRFGKLKSWIAAGSRVALAAERKPEERWSAR
jgi:hypothetical protein